MARRVPSYRLHKPSGQAVTTINYKDHYLGKHGSRESKRAYSRLIEEYQTTTAPSSFGIEDQATIAMILVDYLAHCDSYYPDTRSGEPLQVRYAARFINEDLDMVAKDFGPKRLKIVRERMLEAVGPGGKPLTRQYINKTIARIVRMFQWAAEEELVDITVYQALANVRGLQRNRSKAPEARKVKPVADEVLEATIKHCTPVVRDMIRFQQLTATRPGEVCCITPGMIDRSGDVWVADLPEHKTRWRGKDRFIYIGPKAQEIIRPYLLRADDAELFSPAESEKHRRAELSAKRVTPASCGNKPGSNVKKSPRKQPRTAYDTQSYGKAIKYACAKAFPIPVGSTKEQQREHREKWFWSPNRIRHSRATELRRTHGLEGAQVILGHSKADVTQVYAEVDKERGIQIAASCG